MPHCNVALAVLSPLDLSTNKVFAIIYIHVYIIVYIFIDCMYVDLHTHNCVLLYVPLVIQAIFQWCQKLLPLLPLHLVLTVH